MPEEPFLYQTIAESIRRQILGGELRPGDRLPTVRQQTARWGCTPGTVQRAYRQLAEQGLIVSRRGQGTQVAGAGPAPENTPLRRVELVHRAEAFLLEVLTAGHAAEEVEGAVRIALDRWRAAAQSRPPAGRGVLRFVGSHDLAVDWLAAHFEQVAPGVRLTVRFTGSLGGLMALAQGEADLAGAHLWDAESGAYNAPFVRRVLPGGRTALITLAHRRLGLIVAAGNPLGLRTLKDLARPRLRFVNRQPGSGTRVWLDAQLERLGVAAERILGYAEAQPTHTAVARAVAAGEADAGLGLEAAAAAFGLDFVFLTAEHYHLVVPAAGLEAGPVQRLVRWLRGRKGRAALGALPGYDASASGEVEWVG